MSAPPVPAQVPAHQRNGRDATAPEDQFVLNGASSQVHDQMSRRDQDEASGPSRFSPQEEATLLDESNALKTGANTLFSNASYSQAVSEYDKALSSCPNYLEYEIAVLHSNIAACHLKLQDWQASVDAAKKALDALERLLPTPKPPKQKKATGSNNSEKGLTDNLDDNDEIVEIDDESEEAEKAHLAALALDDQRKLDVRKLRAKALMRRAKGKQNLGGWGNLQGAEDDYKAVLSLSSPLSTKNALTLPPQDKRTVETALRTLPAQIATAREKEMGEMWGKLKDLGNGILKPFGLSTDNFKMVQDEKTGGYSMNFSQS